LELFAGRAVTHFNEVDECAGVDGLITDRVWRDLGLDPSNTLHDVRWGASHEGRFVWVLLNSGSCGAYAFNHEPGTLRGAHSYRQPALYFPTPGGTFAGESLPGPMTWARTDWSRLSRFVSMAILDSMVLAVGSLEEDDSSPSAAPAGTPADRADPKRTGQAQRSVFIFI